MTPETIKAAIESNRSGQTPTHSHVVTVAMLQSILTRILCPAPSGPTTRDTFDAENQEPAARPDSAGEGRKDRAGEIADGLLLSYSTWSGSGLCEHDRPRFEREIVDALLAYGDELLEKAAKEIAITRTNRPGESLGLATAIRVISAQKSSPTGATNDGR